MLDRESKLEKKRVSILGCGWLGFPLAQRLQRDHITLETKGSTTSADKLASFQDHGIKGYLLDLTPGFSDEATLLHSFFDSDCLIVSLPPRQSKNEPGFYVQQIQAVAAEIKKSPIKEVILISSTGIYPELNRIVTEEDVLASEESAPSDMVAAENLLQSLRPDITVTILRLGGLMGYNRIPGKYVKGQKNMITGSIPVNYIHRDDAVGIIISILEQGLVNETFNIVSPLHPVRRDIYENSCSRFNWEAPTFAEPDISPDFKVISGEKFDSTYSYNFIFPDPLKFYYSLENEM
ncbi:NAD-dependent dehydratase [Dyadobacter pollutisoli]|jgi:nucleoside-diphosphate-sugar epimerase|uniref:NAD-dependent dehydratase n=1 Tax=Dyadobacter pollutisoli TaxID=2910158 RepID=A0A9E8NA04_9BACT|nr:NAD-dependent dehydratase [Dyadobacter pollutisoli]WAC10721.1 NAD-dependent dehydratase [Dyadobacter pollutisoli]